MEINIRESRVMRELKAMFIQTNKSKQMKKSIQSAKLAFDFLQTQEYLNLPGLIGRPIAIALAQQGNDSEEE